MTGVFPGVVSMEGIGLHSGLPCRASFREGPPGSGIVFQKGDRSIPARIDYVDRDAHLTTRLGGESGAVGMVEHLLAAIGAMGIRDLVVDVEGPEIPALDGSARQWIDCLGCLRQESLGFVAPARSFTVRSGDSSVRLAPLAPGQRPSYRIEVDFVHPMIGSREFTFHPLDESFDSLVAPARTFGFLRDVERLRQAGLALGGSLENAVVFDDDGVVGSRPLRFADEPVRHKMLDLLGDLMLLGAWPYAAVEAVRPGHRLIHELCAAVQGSGTHHIEILRD